MKKVPPLAEWQYALADNVGAATFRKVSGTLPAGTDLAADGTLSGTPTTVADYVFSVAVTDECSASSTVRMMSVSVQSNVAASDALPSSISGYATATFYDADTTADSSVSPRRAHPTISTTTRP